MELDQQFKEFLAEIRPTDNQKNDMKKGHTLLRERLMQFEKLKPIIVTSFIQGSYRRSTAVRPKSDKRSDVDIVVVTNLPEAKYTPNQAMGLFKPFLNTHYKDKWRTQGRSFGIELSYVELDLVITSAPSEVDQENYRCDAVSGIDLLEDVPDWRFNASWKSIHNRVGYSELMKKAASEPEWKLNPLRIPDRNSGNWENTHPLEQIRWTRDKNCNTNGHFVNVVKALKWWRLENYSEPKHPKGFPLERLIGECCPDEICSVAQGIVETLEKIRDKYQVTVLSNSKPRLSDYGVPEHDVFKRISADDFAKFYEQVKEGAALARKAYDYNSKSESGKLWRELLGDKFPLPPEEKKSQNNSSGGFTQPTGPAVPRSGRFA
ncbi:MAG: nucleotidyltransferase [Candidatus Cloacimonetes bacterium]|nr:nucleotidyltransferase [Candidatus Cloacimonadota bacterium]